ncbi:MAG: hypothetical protein K6F23_14385 [Solobacterium sp.]|nr:hypothetical protein [Solobacterium sp.]
MASMSASGRRTDRDIRESMIRLPEEKPLYRIIVQDLCWILFHDTEGVLRSACWRKYSKLPLRRIRNRTPRRFRISYMYGGILTVIPEWIRNDCRPAKAEVAKVIGTGVHQAFAWFPDIEFEYRIANTQI